MEIGPKVHSICEMGAYFHIGGNIVFVSNQATELKIIVEIMEKSLEDEWPTKWEEIKKSIPGEFDFEEDYEPRTQVVSDISDFFFLTEYDLLTAGVGEKMTEKILKSIAKSKSQSYEKCLFALGIKNVGRGTAKELVRYYPTIDDLGRAPFSDLVRHSNIGGTVAMSIVQYFHRASSWHTIERLRLGGVDTLFGWKPEVPSPDLIPSVEGKEFMFTGRLSITRTKASMLVIEKGGYIGSSVRKDTDYLVVGEEPGEKQFKAQALGVKMISEEQFFQLLEGKDIV